MDDVRIVEGYEVLNFALSLHLNRVPCFVCSGACLRPLALLCSPIRITITFPTSGIIWNLTNPNARDSDIDDVRLIIGDRRPHCEQTVGQGSPQTISLRWIVEESVN